MAKTLAPTVPQNLLNVFSEHGTHSGEPPSGRDSGASLTKSYRLTPVLARHYRAQQLSIGLVVEIVLWPKSH